jgi:hypothetical protein
MNQKFVLILFLTICGVLALAAGCTSPVLPARPQPNATPVVFTPESIKDLPFVFSDLPQGYSIVYRSQMAPGNPNCTSEVCYVAGYFTSAQNGQSNTSTIDQAVTIYNTTTTAGTLLPVLIDQIPDVASGNLTALPGPGLGDASAAYRFTIATSAGPVNGYLVIIERGNLYEIIMVIGPDASENLALDMAHKAATKLP